MQKYLKHLFFGLVYCVCFFIQINTAIAAKKNCIDREINKRLGSEFTKVERLPDGTVKTERIIWGKWNCKSCGLKDISAEPKTGAKVAACPNCGSTMNTNKGENYHLGHKVDSKTGQVLDANVVDTEEEYNIAKSGPDWDCKFCNTRNRSLMKECESCGAVVDESISLLSNKERIKMTGYKIDELPPPKSSPAFISKSANPIKSETTAQPYFKNKLPELLDVETDVPQTPAAPFKKPLSKNQKIATGVGVGATVTGGTLIWGFSTHKEDSTLVLMEWVHTETRQTFTRTHKRDWRDQIPTGRPRMPVNGVGEYSGSENIQLCADEFYRNEDYVCGTEQVCSQEPESYQCGTSKSCSTRDNGNGSFTETCVDVPQYCTRYNTVCHNVDKHCTRPIYKERCDYDTYEWFNKQKEATRGINPTKGTTSLPWPELKPGKLDRILHDSEYTLNYEYKDDRETKKISEHVDTEGEFLSWEVGDQITLYIRNFGWIARKERKKKKD